MSRHRDVRNRQFSYDEGDEDYYDDDEEADAACEEHRLSVVNARGEGSGFTTGISNSGGGSGSVVSLSSYFDIPDTSQRQRQEQSRENATQSASYGGAAAAGMSDINGAAAAAADADANAEDAELVVAIAGELEKRLGKRHFAPQQVRQAVVESGYEVDTAEVILLTMDQAAAANENHEFRNNPPSPPLGLDITPVHHSEPYSGSTAPSSLAFGLKVDGQFDWRRVGGSGSGSGAGANSNSRAAIVTTTAGGDNGFEPFGFDTPSPDDVNLHKQWGAGGIGGGGRPGGLGSENPVNAGGVAAAGTAGSRRKKATVTSLSSPKAKVVHISTRSTPTTATRKSVLSPTKQGASAQAQATQTTRGVSDRELSPMRPKPSASPTPQAQATTEGADESDEGEAGGKERLAMVVIGHVDAGKSTLMGQVLVQMGQVSQRVLHKQEKEAKEAGKASFFLAWVMDEDQEERAHGVTIDVAQKYIETESKLVTLLDAPGHRDFIPKMIGGASAADAAVLVVPAAAGEFESGFQANGQTKEHAMLAKALGVNQLLVVVNKLDATDPPWSQERYDAIKAEVGPFLTSQRTGFKPKKVRFVPASGLSGENISRRSLDGSLAAWYDGPTLLEAIDAFSPAPRATDKPFRMCVADVVATGKGVSVSGRVVQGRVRVGDKVLVMPLEDPATVVRLEHNGAPARSSRAGDNAEISLSGVDASRVLVGNVVCKAAAGGSRVATARRFNAQIVALPALEVPVIKGTEFQMHMHNLDAMVHCSRLVSLTNSAGEVLKSKPRCVPMGSTAQIRISCSRPICLERYSDCRALGRFVLRQKGVTVAVGLVLETGSR